MNCLFVNVGANAFFFWNSLAYCNMYTALAALTLRVFPRMELYETDLDDVRYDHDLVAPAPKSGSKGVRVDMS